MDDKQIIELYFKRDERAILHTDKKYGNSLHSVSYRIIQSRRDSEECVNDTYLKVWNSVPPNRPEKLFSYLIKIVRNLSFNRCEYLKAKKRGGGEYQAVLDELSYCIPDRFSTEERFDNERLAKLINEFLLSETEDNAVIFIQRYFYLCSVKEIAQEKGISQSKVKMTLLRLRQTLKEMLIKEGIEV